jgi:hypothetical protein
LLLVRQSDAISPILDSLILIWSASEAKEWTGVVGVLATLSGRDLSLSENSSERAAQKQKRRLGRL